MQCPRRADRAVQLATLTAQGELDRATADSGDCAKAMTGRRSPCGPLANHRSARRSPPPWRRDNIAGQPARRAGGSRRLISRISIHPLLQLNTERHWLRTPTERSLGSVCPAELVDLFMTYPRRITAEATAESLRSLQQTDLSSMLGELSSVPTAVVHGSRDPTRTLSHAESLSNGIPGSRLVVLDTGHTSCVEEPAEFAQAIRSVVEQGLKADTGRAD